MRVTDRRRTNPGTRLARATEADGVLRELLLTWMAAHGLSRDSQVSGWIRDAPAGAVRWALSWTRAGQLAGIACYATRRPHSPVVIVAARWRGRGLGTRLLQRLKARARRSGDALRPWTVGPAGDAVCRRAGLRPRRLVGGAR